LIHPVFPQAANERHRLENQAHVSNAHQLAQFRSEAGRGGASRPDTALS
jgi:hypothetical protein